MRQIDLTVPSHRADGMLLTEPIKPPMTLDLPSNVDLKDDLIENSDQIVLQDESSIDGETIATEESLRSSPRSSRSSSLNSFDTNIRSPTNTKQGYERKLLKKHLLVPEISIEISSPDDYRLDDEARAKILDYKSDVERPGKIRKQHSFNDKLKSISGSKGTKGKTSTMKKIIKSPSLLRRSYSFKNTDSNVSSSAETTANDTEKRKKRKISIGKRRKSSKHKEPETPTEEDVKVEKPERSTKFRRKKLVKSQSESSLSSYNANKSKLILLYSGDSPLKNDKINRKNRLGMLKHKDSVESSSEYDEYSSAFSEGENDKSLNSSSELKPRKLRRGVAKRVWKSINGLFVTDDQSPPKPSFFSTPPLLRRNSTKSHSKSRSMPGGLHRVKSFSGQKNTSSKVDERIAKDDLSLLKKRISLNGNSLISQTTKKKVQKLPRDQVNGETRARRSKSLDHLLDTRSIRRNESSDTDWFEPRKKSHSTLTPSEHDKKIAKDALEYKIIVFQEPKKKEQQENEPTELMKDSGKTVSNPKDTNHNNSEKTNNKNEIMDINNNKAKTKTMERHREYIKVRLQDLKATCQKEMEMFLSDKQFVPEHVNDWCRVLSESIKDRIVKITGETHKVVAQVFIGALYDDGIHAAIQCISGQKKSSEKTDESFFSATYKGKDLFAVASVLAFEL